MWNSNSSNKGDIWKIIQDEFLVELERECVQMAIGASHPDKTHALELTFDELRDRTRCDEYPKGLDFESASDDSVGGFLYANRVKIAENYRLYFTSIYAVGLKFTANPWLGMKWREEFELERAYTKADVSEKLWAIAERQLPVSQRPMCKYFRQDAARRVQQIEKTQRLHERKFKQLETGGSQN